MVGASSLLRRGVPCFGALASMAVLGGCHSRYVEATVTNATASPVSLVEVDYPSASFGRETLAAGAVYHYRFKVLGSGVTKVLWTDAGHVEHTVAGPELHEGDEGRLAVEIAGPSATWGVAVKQP